MEHVAIKPTMEIVKSKIETVKIGLSVYGGKQLVDVRSWMAFQGDEYRPTQKGCSLPIEKIDDLIKGLQMARDDAVTRGWLK